MAKEQKEIISTNRLADNASSSDIKKQDAVNLLRKNIEKHTSVINFSTDNINGNSVLENENIKTLKESITNEIGKNETKRREHKDILLRVMIWFLGIQFGLFFVLLSGTIIVTMVAHLIGNPFSLELIRELYKILTTYLASVIVEMLSMLFFVIRNVFDTTIKDLTKLVASH